MAKILTREEWDSMPPREVRLPAGTVVRPPLDFAKIRAEIGPDSDPEETEAFLEVIRQIRRPTSTCPTQLADVSKQSHPNGRYTENTMAKILTIEELDAMPPREIRLPPGIKVKPPLNREEIQADIHHDPEEGEALVELIRQLRREGLDQD